MEIRLKIKDIFGKPLHIGDLVLPVVDYKFASYTPVDMIVKETDKTVHLVTCGRITKETGLFIRDHRVLVSYCSRDMLLHPEVTLSNQEKVGILESVIEAKYDSGHYKNSAIAIKNLKKVIEVLSC